MDVEILFWIAVALFYFFSRVISGRNKSKRTPGKAPDRKERSRAAGEKVPQDELEQAIQEIQRALGYGSRKPEKDEKPTPADETARGSLDVSDRTMRPGRGQTGAERRDTSMGGSIRPDTTERSGLPRRDARELERQKVLLDRSQAASRRERSRSRRSSEPGGIVGAHPLEAGYKEEELFQRSGPHAHTDKSASTLDSGNRKSTETGTQSTRMMDRLKGRTALREAFILKEVLDRPLSMRRERR